MTKTVPAQAKEIISRIDEKSDAKSDADSSPAASSSQYGRSAGMRRKDEEDS